MAKGGGKSGFLKKNPDEKGLRKLRENDLSWGPQGSNLT